MEGQRISQRKEKNPDFLFSVERSNQSLDNGIESNTAWWSIRINES